MCYLRGDYRSGHFGESEIDEVGPGAKHEKQEKVRTLIWAGLSPHKNTKWSFVRFVTEKENYPGTLMVLMFAKNVGDLSSLEENRKEI